MSGIGKRLDRIEREIAPTEPIKFEVRWSIVKGGHGMPALATRGYTQEELNALPRLTDGSLDDDKVEWFPHEEKRPA